MKLPVAVVCLTFVAVCRIDGGMPPKVTSAAVSGRMGELQDELNVPQVQSSLMRDEYFSKTAIVQKRDGTAIQAPDDIIGWLDGYGTNNGHQVEFSDVQVFGRDGQFAVLADVKQDTVRCNAAGCTPYGDAPVRYKITVFVSLFRKTNIRVTEWIEIPGGDFGYGAPDIDLTATCDDQMTLYADGQQLATNNNWEESTTVAIPSDTKVVGIMCTDKGVRGGILASLSNGLVTDGSWKCSITAGGYWTDEDYDDSSWDWSTIVGINGAKWNIVSGISTSAYWIWTPRWKSQDKLVYCRKVLSDQRTHPVPPLLSDSQAAISATCDNKMELFADGESLGTTNDWRQSVTQDIPLDTKVVSIKCIDQGGRGGILASINNGLVTDQRWKCSATATVGWKVDGFDDSSWDWATIIAINGLWWSRKADISDSAYWIWTPLWRYQDKTVYCRIVLTNTT